ncbi:MAG: hypothetical protein JW966_10500 [Anaerolineae bacterium]|nr:hypothetical protein [Anaerolineae bacterium]
MGIDTGTQRCNWIVLQTGRIPLRPDGVVDHMVEHRCTSVLVWPDDQTPQPNNTVITDPCFTEAGLVDAVRQLETVGAVFDDVGYLFVTHLHADHMLHMPYTTVPPRLRPLRTGQQHALPGLYTENCPGHHPLLMALFFYDQHHRAIWIAGDAVLDDEWLRAWGYYWPNNYTPDDIIQTWRSVAHIVSRADVIVPGHGPPIDVSASLVSDLAAGFPHAPHADACPDVIDTLEARLAVLAHQRG